MASIGCKSVSILLQNRDIRLHAAYAYNIGNNTNPAGTALNKGSFFTVGLTWRIDVLSAAGKLIEKIKK